MMSDFMKVDVVIPWVDSEDPLWNEKRNSWSHVAKTKEGNSSQRFRDFGTLKYLLRSIEENADWVNKVYILTDDQVPDWINEKEVQIIDHKDFIPAEYLPTFNSNVIELNAWRIPNLSERFILLNDDLVFVGKTRRSDFFNDKGFPMDVMAQSILMPRDDFSHIAVNNIAIINKSFDKRTWLKKYWSRAFSFKNGVSLNSMSLGVSLLKYFTRFYDPHVATPYLKSSFEWLYDTHPTTMAACLKNKFRGYDDISHWAVRYYQIVSGISYPKSYKYGRYLEITDCAQLKAHFRNRSTKIVALNDKVSSREEWNLAMQTIDLLDAKYYKQSKYEW